jgi:hypothetical protein
MELAEQPKLLFSSSFFQGQEHGRRIGGFLSKPESSCVTQMGGSMSDKGKLHGFFASFNSGAVGKRAKQKCLLAARERGCGNYWSGWMAHAFLELSHFSFDTRQSFPRSIHLVFIHLLPLRRG